MRPSLITPGLASYTPRSKVKYSVNIQIYLSRISKLIWCTPAQLLMCESTGLYFTYYLAQGDSMSSFECDSPGF